MNGKRLQDILDLHKKWLNGDPDGIRANMSFKSFENGSLQNVDLRYATLTNCNFTYAFLFNSDLLGADLSNSDLSNSCLEYARLLGANLSNSKLNCSSLKYTNLENADLTNSKISNVFAFKSCFKNANLFNTNLSYSRLYKSNFINANLLDANLENSHIYHINLGEVIKFPNIMDTYYFVKQDIVKCEIIKDFKNLTLNEFECLINEKLNEDKTFKRFLECSKFIKHLKNVKYIVDNEKNLDLNPDSMQKKMDFSQYEYTNANQ